MEEFLRKVRGELGSDALLQDEDQSFYLLIDEGLSIRLFSPGDKGVTFRTAVGKTTESAELEPLFTELLLANLFGQGTAGGVLSLGADGRTIFLSHSFLERETPADLYQALEEFVNYAIYWKEKIAR